MLIGPDMDAHYYFNVNLSSSNNLFRKACMQMHGVAGSVLGIRMSVSSGKVPVLCVSELKAIGRTLHAQNFALEYIDEF